MWQHQSSESPTPEPRPSPIPPNLKKLSGHLTSEDYIYASSNPELFLLTLEQILIWEREAEEC